MLRIIKTRHYVFMMVLLTAVAIIGWTGGAAMAADTMAKEPMAAEKMVEKPAEIPFVDLTGVQDWRAEGMTHMLIEGINGQWIRVTFFSECFGLPWAERIAFVTSPNGSLDKFSSVIVNGQQCYFKDAQKISNPDKK